MKQPRQRHCRGTKVPGVSRYQHISIKSFFFDLLLISLISLKVLTFYYSYILKRKTNLSCSYSNLNRIICNLNRITNTILCTQILLPHWSSLFLIHLFVRVLECSNKCQLSLNHICLNTLLKLTVYFELICVFPPYFVLEYWVCRYMGRKGKESHETHTNTQWPDHAYHLNLTYIFRNQPRASGLGQRVPASNNSGLAQGSQMCLPNQCHACSAFR